MVDGFVDGLMDGGKGKMEMVGMCFTLLGIG